MASPPTKKAKTSADESNSDTNNTIFICTGTTFKPAAKADLKIRNELPVGTYTIAVSQEGYFLKKIENFKPATGKIYGDLPNQATRILTTFLDRPTSTGILLAGEKGSGKTLLTKQVSLMAQEQSIPTIVVNSALKGEAFNAFLQLIEQPTVMIFDEYEKVYNHYDQKQLLTLLDGVYPSKKLFLLTTNSRWGIDSHMLNRPGRLFYVVKFKGLNLEFVKGYAEENLKNKVHVEKVCVVAAVFGAFNLDMLKALVEEMNRYDESPGQSLKWLNINPEFDYGSKYDLEWKGPGGNAVALTSKTFDGNPLKDGLTLVAKETPSSDGEKGKEKSDEDKKITVDAKDFHHLEMATKALVFAKNGNRIIATRVVKVDFDWETLGVNTDSLDKDEVMM